MSDLAFSAGDALTLILFLLFGISFCGEPDLYDVVFDNFDLANEVMRQALRPK